LLNFSERATELALAATVSLNAAAEKKVLTQTRSETTDQYQMCTPGLFQDCQTQLHDILGTIRTTIGSSQHTGMVTASVNLLRMLTYVYGGAVDNVSTTAARLIFSI